jgi:hypothetical protein
LDACYPLGIETGKLWSKWELAQPVVYKDPYGLHWLPVDKEGNFYNESSQETNN